MTLALATTGAGLHPFTPLPRFLPQISQKSPTKKETVSKLVWQQENLCGATVFNRAIQRLK